MRLQNIELWIVTIDLSLYDDLSLLISVTYGRNIQEQGLL